MSVHIQKDLREAYQKCSGMANINTTTVLHNIQLLYQLYKTNFTVHD